MRVTFPLVFFFVLATFNGSALAQEGPFGVRMGMPIERLPGCVESEWNNSLRGLIICDYLPKGHPDMEIYTVYAYPLTGVCSVSAETIQIEDESAARKMYRKIVNQISQLYGPPPGDSDDEITVWIDGELYLSNLDMISVLYGVKSTHVNFIFGNQEKCEIAENSSDDDGGDAFR